MAISLELLSHFPVTSYKAEDVVIEEGLKDGTIYILKKGSVSIQKRGTEVSRSASPGAVFGEVSVLLDAPHSATVIALEPCEFYLAADAEQVLHDHPELVMQISKLLAFRLMRVTDQMVEMRQQIEASDAQLGEIAAVIKNLW